MLQSRVYFSFYQGAVAQVRDLKSSPNSGHGFANVALSIHPHYKTLVPTKYRLHDPCYQDDKQVAIFYIFVINCAQNAACWPRFQQFRLTDGQKTRVKHEAF